VAPHFPVSIKGVVLIGGLVVLLRNERGEWELPGGRLEADEAPEQCLKRDIAEELAIEAEVQTILDCWRYQPEPGKDVVIVTYGCRTSAAPAVTRSEEHSEVGLFALNEIDGANMPEGYRRSIRQWAQLSG
jgi:8-oxo-dGTP pyrophosphatase MutT (NUDIX family)